MYLRPCRLLSVIFIGFIFILIACKEDRKVIKQKEVTFTKEGTLTLLKTTTDSTKITIDIEIADTDYDIQTGLMYRNSMKSNQGMLFVFDDVRERSFYMKNTRIPLDLVFIDATNTIVSFQKNTKPFNETSLPSKVPAKYVLEVNAGLVNRWGLSVGDRISYKK